MRINLRIFAAVFIGSLCCATISFSQTKQLDSAAYVHLYLTAQNLPGMKQDQYQPWRLPDDDDTSYNRYHGLAVGMSVWDADLADTIQRVVDIHWVFPDSANAHEYFNETLLSNSEGARCIDPGPQIGDEAHFYLNAGKSFIDTNYVMAHFYCLFRVGRVVSKLFVAQGTAFHSFVLRGDQVMSIAQRIEDRIRTSGL